MTSMKPSEIIPLSAHLFIHSSSIHLPSIHPNENLKIQSQNQESPMMFLLLLHFTDRETEMRELTYSWIHWENIV